MSFLSRLLRAWLLGRLMRGPRRSSPYGRPRGYGRPMAYGRRRRSRGGFFGPFPYYSTRTRGGSRVAVSGCCLPIPLTLSLALGFAARALVRR